MDTRRICRRSRFPTAEFWERICQSESDYDFSQRAVLYLLKNKIYSVSGIGGLILCDIPNTIQPREYSMGSGHDGAGYITFEGNQQSCYAWWNDAKRKANLNWVSNFTNANDWFAFLCESIYFSSGLPGEFCFKS